MFQVSGRRINYHIYKLKQKGEEDISAAGIRLLAQISKAPGLNTTTNQAVIFLNLLVLQLNGRNTAPSSQLHPAHCPTPVSQ
jgi:hypothetical protein